MKERVAVGMSGGVDSSVAAALLKQKGYEVIGVTLHFDSLYPDKKSKRRWSLSSVTDSRKVAHKLGIKHYILDVTGDFKKKVLRDFCREYQEGRTPNPCIRCNRYIKFDVLMKEAFSQGAKFLATGHYARIKGKKTGNHKPKTYLLKKARDLSKDQSYFLYRLTQNQLKHVIFPLGGYTKAEVRAKAKDFSLPVMDKADSQEICFLGDADYRKFLERQVKRSSKPGPFVDKHGKILGKHKGISFYTIGQRQGLGIALGYPAYVTNIDPKNNRITVGEKEDCYKKDFLIKEPHFISRTLKKKIALKVRIRYNHPEAEAEVIPEHNRIRIRFTQPQFAITPGQSAVFYDGDVVLGGGIIDKVVK
jgi:tRNA-specific 2-thiouridylase